MEEELLKLNAIDDSSFDVVQTPIHESYHTEITNQITNEAEQEIIWDIYKISFKNFRKSSKDQLHLTFKELRDILLDTEFVKFILWKDKEIIGFFITTNNLHKLKSTYIDLDHFINKYSDFHVNKKIYFIEAICIPSKELNRECIKNLIEAVIYFYKRKESIAALDTPKNTTHSYPKEIRNLLSEYELIKEKIDPSEQSTFKQEKFSYIKKILDIADKRGLYPNYRKITSASTTPTVKTSDGREVLSFCTNNYLGLSFSPKVVTAAIDAIKKYGTGCGGARVTSGNLDIHECLEKRLARFKGTEDAILFMTGYMANIGIITTFMDSIIRKGIPRETSQGVILVDKLSHASIIDACRLSNARTFTYHHNNTEHLESLLIKFRNSKKIIVTDGVFSMDGDIAPLPEIVRLAEKYNAYTMVDDAHATGVLGKNGRGTIEYFNLDGKIDIIVATLSKSFGGVGGFVAGSHELVRYLRILARPYVFSSPLPPSTIAGAIASLDEIENNPILREKMHHNSNFMKNELVKLGFNILPTETPIIPIIIGKENDAIKFSNILFEKGLFIPPITWPAVAINGARLRCIVTSAHTQEQIIQALKILKEVKYLIGI